MGGRGAASGYSGPGSTSGNGKGARRFYDKTSKFKGMSIHEFENAVRDKKVEYIGIYDDKGKLIVAGTSYNSHAVNIPTNHPEFSKAHTLTHNHPYNPTDEPYRTIGASFSETDISNHIRMGFKGETRAVSNGPNENTYIFRAKAGAKQDNLRMYKHMAKIKGQWQRKGNQKVDDINKRLAKQGKSLSPSQRKQVLYGMVKKGWQSIEVKASGYEYIEIKKAHW